jgi:hypothetical protein
MQRGAADRPDRLRRHGRLRATSKPNASANRGKRWQIGDPVRQLSSRANDGVTLFGQFPAA